MTTKNEVETDTAPFGGHWRKDRPRWLEEVGRQKTAGILPLDAQLPTTRTSTPRPTYALVVHHRLRPPAPTPWPSTSADICSLQEELHSQTSLGGPLLQDLLEPWLYNRAILHSAQDEGTV